MGRTPGSRSNSPENTMRAIATLVSYDQPSPYQISVCAFASFA